VLGCVGLNSAFAIPVSEMGIILPNLYVTQREHALYYHLHLEPQNDHGMRLRLRNGKFLDLRPFTVTLG